ncbi:conserved exported protein of unknown function [uncultured Sphingopyxis sp.]|uniref:DUF2155 domain-containing protein n=1 Tax=uncultured Sphingopyxis sp. TaxID=310581 RepID=A0A1Y5PUJ1_9SPHN|nr:conserved exported protein of unknown function [uncultured Sphingopyxis sp.]
MRPQPLRIALLTLVATAALTACDRTPSKGGSASVPTAAKSERVPQEVGGIEGATPMAERVAVVGLLNKRNGLVRELEMKPGESVRVGRAIVRMRACEMTAPWEDPPETGAFVQLTVQDQRDDKWRRVFSGWIFRERPDRNVIEHPIYDVFVKSCAMTYPGGEPVERSAPKSAAAPKASSAPQSPATNGGEGTATPAAPAAPAPAPVAPPKLAPPSPPANTE